MYTADRLVHVENTSGNTITFSSCNFRILGSSIPTLLERSKSYDCFSITVPEEKQSALIFFITSNNDRIAFLKIGRKENGKVWAFLDDIPVPPCEMFVNGDTITIKTSDGKIVTTGDISGAYKVTGDAMCKFLIKDITEEELLAEAVKLAEETSELERWKTETFYLRDLVRELNDKLVEKPGELERLRQEISDLKAVIQLKDKMIESKETRLRLIYFATKEPWM